MYAPLENPQTQEVLQELQKALSSDDGSAKDDSNNCNARLYSMRADYNEDLLTRFYNQLMITSFPLEQERDELEDWIQCVDPKFANHDDGEKEIVDMDVLILGLVGPGLDERNDIGDFKDPTEIVAGIAFEYYKPSKVGLISYLCVSTKYRRRGLIRILHPLAVACLNHLHALYKSSGNIRAVLAETNTLTAGDAPPAVIAQRHTVLHRLGYRQLQVPYVQPPLSMIDEESFDDILLLLYCGNVSERNNSNANREGADDATTISSQVILDFVTDFYQSVYGRINQHLYQQHWYYRVLSWFCEHNGQIALSDSLHDNRESQISLSSSDVFSSSTDFPSSPPPWTEDCTNKYRKEFFDNRMKTVGIVGAGIAGLVASVELAKKLLLEHATASKTEENSPQPYTIVLWEAHEYVGGRIRTILTERLENDDNPVSIDPAIRQSSSNSLLMGKNISIEKYKAFAPWPISIGGEFVHGARGILNDIIMEQNWPVEETFDLSTYPVSGETTNEEEEMERQDEEERNRPFLSRKETKRLSPEQLKYGPVRVFGDGELWPLNNCGVGSEVHYGGNSAVDASDSNKSKFPILLRKAKYIWSELCMHADQVKSSQEIPDDVSLENFVRQRLSTSEQESNDVSIASLEDASGIAVVLQILEAMYANTAASKTDSYGIYEASREEDEWDYSEHNFRTPEVFADLVEYYLNQVDQINAKGRGLVVISIQISSPVTRISDYGNPSKVVVDVTQPEEPTKNEFVCDKVIVAVPLAVLKATMIVFDGNRLGLPIQKQMAIESVNMFSGLKIHVLLKCGVDIPRMPLALQMTELVFCPGEYCVQVWFRRNQQSVLITGFVPANARDRMLEAAGADTNEKVTDSISTGSKLQKLVLDQLRRMFENKTEFLFYPEKEATCSGFLVHDWSDDEYVRGLYSSPSVGAGISKNSRTTTCRHDLARPIADTIFFAGEHTNTSTCATVQAAMESGIRAAEEVWNSI